MNRLLLYFLSALFLTACAPKNETKLDTVNFNLQIENHDNIIKIRLVETQYSKNETGYPLHIRQKCEVLEIYRGNYAFDEITLVTDHEDMPQEYEKAFEATDLITDTSNNRVEFFFYNDEQRISDTEYQREFGVWSFTEEYEKHLIETI